MNEISLVGNGTDNTAEFLAACVESMATGKTVHLYGEHVLGGWVPLDLTGRLRLQGHGGARVIGPGGNQYMFNASDDFEIRGISFSNWHGILQRWSYKYGKGDPLFPWATTNIAAANEVREDCVFSNNIVEGATGYVVSLGVKLNGLEICKNKFLNCSGGYVLRIGEKTIGEILGSFIDVTISGNRAKNLTGPANHGVSFLCGYLGEASDVSGNRVRNVLGNGVGEAWGIYLQAHDCTVANNRIYDVTTSGSSSDITGISLKGGVEDANSPEQTGMSYQCFGNVIRRIGTGTQWGSGVKAQSRRSQVLNNDISACRYAGIALDNLLTSQDQSARGNVIVDCRRGVIITGNGIVYAITDNQIRLCQQGIVVAPGVYGANAGLLNAKIEGNQISYPANASVGIVFQPATVVTGLYVTENVINCVTAYFWGPQAGGSFVQTVIKDDHRSLCGTQHYGAIPAGVVVA